MPLVVTSKKELENLKSMFGQTHKQTLLKSPLFVVSQRAVALKKELGFTKKPFVSQNANNEAI